MEYFPIFSILQWIKFSFFLSFMETKIEDISSFIDSGLTFLFQWIFLLVFVWFINL